MKAKLLTALLLGGVGGMAGINVRHGRYEQFKKSEVRDVIDEEPYAVQVFLHLPLNAVSRLWGKMCNITLPVWSRPHIFGLYIKKYNCNLAEAENEDLKSYRSLGEFFKRNLKSEARPIDHSHSLVSPCDGLILSYGKITKDKVEHVKLKTYSLKYFLGPKTWKENNSIFSNLRNSTLTNKTQQKMNTPTSNNGEDGNMMANEHESSFCKEIKLNNDTDLYHCIIYLAPGDYHKFHSPANWFCSLRRYFPGYLLSVSPKMADKFPELLNVNERVVYVGQWESGFFSMAAVGATNVGSIRVYKDPELKTNQKANQPSMVDLPFDSFFSSSSSSSHTPPPATLTSSSSSPSSSPASPSLATSLYFTKGEQFGEFNLGSTIVLIFEADKNFKFSAQPNDYVKFGQGLGN